MKAYSQDLRDRVIDLHFNQQLTKAKVARLLNISYDTVRGWIKRYHLEGHCHSRQHLNPGKACRFTDKQALLDYLEANPDADGIELRDAVAPELPMSTFYDTLKRLGITYKKKNPNTNSVRKPPASLI